MIQQQHLLNNSHEYQFGQFTIPNAELKPYKGYDIKIRSKPKQSKINHQHPIVQKQQIYIQALQSLNKKQINSQKQKKSSLFKKPQYPEVRQFQQRHQKQKQYNLKNIHQQSRSENKKEKHHLYHPNAGQIQSSEKLYFIKQKSHHSLQKQEYQNVHLPSLNKNKNAVILNQEDSETIIFSDVHQKLPKTIKIPKQKLKLLKPEQIKLKFQKKIKAQQKIRAKDMAKQFWKDEEQDLIPHEFQQYGQNRKNANIFKLY